MGVLIMRQHRTDLNWAEAQFLGKQNPVQCKQYPEIK